MQPQNDGPLQIRSLMYSRPEMAVNSWRRHCRRLKDDIGGDLEYLVELTCYLSICVEKDLPSGQWDDAIIEIMRTGARMRRRSRDLAQRFPVPRPTEPIVCPQCEFTVRRGTRVHRETRKSPAPAPMPTRTMDETPKAADVPKPSSIMPPPKDPQHRNASDSKPVPIMRVGLRLRQRRRTVDFGRQAVTIRRTAAKTRRKTEQIYLD